MPRKTGSGRAAAAKPAAPDKPAPKAAAPDERAPEAAVPDEPEAPVRQAAHPGAQTVRRDSSGMMKKVRSASGLLDQIFSSASNGLILFALAVVATPETFGRVSLLFTLLAAAVGVLRGALGTPLLLAAGSGDAEIRRQGGYSMAAAALAGIVMSSVLLIVGALLGVFAESLLMAVTIPIVLMQDVLRYVAIAYGRSHHAMVWDGLWFIGSVTFLVLAWTTPDSLTPNSLVFGWCALATIALVGLAVSVATGPRLSGLWAWATSDGWHRLRYGIDSGLEQTTVFVILAVVGGFVDVNASAALRGSTAALAPLAILSSAVPLLIIPASARSGRNPVETWRQLVKVALATSTIALVGGVVLSVLPDSIGRLALGDTFALSRGVVFFVAAEYATSGWLFALGIYLKSRNHSAGALAVKCCWVATTLTAVGVALVIDRSALSVALGMVAASIVMCIGALSWFRPWRAPALATSSVDSLPSVGLSTTSPVDGRSLEGTPLNEAPTKVDPDGSSCSRREFDVVGAAASRREPFAEFVRQLSPPDSPDHAHYRHRRQTSESWSRQ